MTEREKETIKIMEKRIWIMRVIVVSLMIAGGFIISYLIWTKAFV